MEEFLKKLVEFNIRALKRIAADDMKMFEEIIDLEKQYHSKMGIKAEEPKSDPLYDSLPKKDETRPLTKDESVELPEKPTKIDFQF